MGTSRRRVRMLALATWLMAAGCAPVPPEKAEVPPDNAERDAAVMRAARACQTSYPAVQVTGVDRNGRLGATSRSQRDLVGFDACFREELRRRSGSAKLGMGRLVAAPSGPNPTTVPMEIAGNAMLVRALVDGTHAVTLLVDTGASLTIVRPQALAAAGVEVSRTAPKLIGTVVGGQKVEMPYVRLRSLRVGDATVEAIDVAAYDATPQMRNVDGLLGGNFLNHFKVTIDRAARMLTLTLPDAPAAPGPSPK